MSHLRFLEWLDGLKAGDEIAVTPSYGSVRIRTVSRVTKAHLVLDDGTHWWRHSGRLVGTSVWSRDRLGEVTPAVREDIERRLLLDRIPRDLSSRTLGELRQIAAVMDPPKDA